MHGCQANKKCTCAPPVALGLYPKMKYPRFTGDIYFCVRLFYCNVRELLNCANEITCTYIHVLPRVVWKANRYKSPRNEDVTLICVVADFFYFLSENYEIFQSVLHLVRITENCGWVVGRHNVDTVFLIENAVLFCDF